MIIVLAVLKLLLIIFESSSGCFILNVIFISIDFEHNALMAYIISQGYTASILQDVFVGGMT